MTCPTHGEREFDREHAEEILKYQEKIGKGDWAMVEAPTKNAPTATNDGTDSGDAAAGQPPVEAANRKGGKA